MSCGYKSSFRLGASMFRLLRVWFQLSLSVIFSLGGRLHVLLPALFRCMLRFIQTISPRLSFSLSFIGIRWNRMVTSFRFSMLTPLLEPHVASGCCFVKKPRYIAPTKLNTQFNSRAPLGVPPSGFVDPYGPSRFCLQFCLQLSDSVSM